MSSQSTLKNTATHSAQQCSTSITQAMDSRHSCPCCCTTLLRHLRSGEIYWRCSSCRQEMPV